LPGVFLATITPRWFGRNVLRGGRTINVFEGRVHMNRLVNRHVRLALLGAIATGAAASPALSAAAVLEEITVTAEKRASTIQETPISITAFTGDDLIDAGVGDSYGLAAFTPGLTIQKEVIGKVVIRGVGTENYTVGSDPGVAIHKDGAYVARSSVSIFDFFDLDRVEVLRGPQGTLYGRNATGGVINILSNEPTEEFEGYVKGDFAEYAKVRLEGAVSGSLGLPGVTGRLSMLYAERDGFTRNVFPTAEARGVDELDNQELWAGRGQVNIAIGENADLLLQAEITRDDSLPPAFKYFDLTNAYWFNAFGPDQDLPDLRTVSQGFEDQIPGAGRTVPSFGRADQDAYLARLTWDLGSTTFTSLTSYRTIDFSWINDGDGFDTFFVTYFQTDESEQLTQEFQLASNTDSKLQWIVGAFYLDEEAETFTGIPFIIGTPNDYILWDGRSDTEAWAVFGQATYAFTDRLTVTAGLRYNEEEKQGDLVYNLFGFVAGPEVWLGSPPGTEWTDVLNDKWDAFTPKLAVDYRFTDDIMGYVSATRGFKSGGFNLLAPQLPYEPEELWSYEAGVKTRWADGRVIANLSTFYYDYTDMQVGKVVNLSATVVNAAEATIMGAELEARALLGNGFELNLGLSLLDTEYEEFVTEDPAWPGDAGCGTLVGAPRTISLEGCQLPRAPEYQAIVGLSWSKPLADGGELRIRGDYSYRGDQYFTQFNRSIVGQDSYGLLNARISYAAPDNRFFVTVYGDNITDEDYFVTVLESGVAAPGTVVPQAVIGAPRMFGMTVGYNF
jgi:iron complex outermembrane recepter protein